MALGTRASRRLRRALVYTFLSAVLVIWLLPVFSLVTTSLKNLKQIYAFPPVLIPIPPLWSNYPKALTAFLPFPIYFRNSAIITSMAIVGSLLSSSFVAYGFARIRFPGRDVLFIVLLSTMMLPFAVRMIPLFLIFKQLKWIDTFLPLTVPSFLGTPLFIFLMRQFFMTIPDDLSDAARIDGCSELGIWWRVMVPLSKPALAVVGVLAFQTSWNDFIQPLIFLNSKDMKTVTLGVYQLIGWHDTVREWQYLMAASVCVVLPVAILFFAAQRLFIQGVTLSAIKG